MLVNLQWKYGVILTVLLTNCSTDKEIIDRRGQLQGIGKPSQGPSADAQKITPEEEEFLNKLNFSSVIECHENGMLFDRRAGICSEEYRLADFPCTRTGIQEKFFDTGFQIVAVLDRALGNPLDPKDRGEGFLIDQCGVNGSGSYLVVLVRPAEDGKITVREIQ